MKKKWIFPLIIVLVFALVLLFINNKNESSRRSVASDAFSAIEAGDVDGFYALLDIDTSNPLLSKEEFLPVFEALTLDEGKKIEKVNALTYKKGDVEITLTADEAKVSATPFISEGINILLPLDTLGTSLKINEKVILEGTRKAGFNEFTLPDHFTNGEYTVLLFAEHVEGVSTDLLKIMSGEFSSFITLTEKAEEDILDFAEKFAKNFYYSAQSDVDFSNIKDEYLYSALTEDEIAKIKALYLDVTALFSRDGGDGIFDLLFTDVIKSLGHDDIYFVNLTLSYSYQFKNDAGEVEDVFDDLGVSVGFVFENDKWAVTSIDAEELV